MSINSGGEDEIGEAATNDDLSEPDKLSKTKNPLKTRIQNRLSKSFDHLDRRGAQKVSEKRRNLLLCRVFLFAFLAVHVGIFAQYVHVWGSRTRTHGWRVLGVIIGVDVEEDSSNCESRNWTTAGNQVKVHKRCLPIIYFGVRSIGLLLYFGMHSVFFITSAIFIMVPDHRRSLKFRGILDGMTFFIGVWTLLDIVMAIIILKTELNGLQDKLEEDCPDPFISYYWEATQTEGHCCGVWGARGHQWWFKDFGPKWFPLSCCDFKSYNCMEPFLDKEKIWKDGCVDYVYYHILLQASFHIIGLILQFFLLLCFDVIQRRFKMGARSKFLPTWAHNISHRNPILPIVSTKQYCVSFAPNANAGPPFIGIPVQLVQPSETTSLHAETSTNSTRGGIDISANPETNGNIPVTTN